MDSETFMKQMDSIHEEHKYDDEAAQCMADQLIVSFIRSRFNDDPFVIKAINKYDQGTMYGWHKINS